MINAGKKKINNFTGIQLEIWLTGGDDMKFYPDCDYFNEERDSEYAPEDKDCESCYRYEICKKCFDKENEGMVMT